MDSIVIVGGIVLFVLLGPWVWAWRVSLRRKRERDEDQEQWRELTSRISALEHAVQLLRRRQPSPSTPETAPRAYEPAVEASRPPATSSPSVAAPPPSPPIAVVDPTTSFRVVEKWVTQRRTEAETAFTTDHVIPPAQSPVVPQPAESLSGTQPAHSFSDRLGSSLDVEEMLGTNWLNKLGIVILVLGVAFFLAYQLRTLGPAGKVMVGFLTAGVMLGAGIWFDRKERYRILARAGIGGGWALLFFTAYAMYHIPAAQVLSSQPADLLLMLGVAAGMVAHTLRYRSQVVTGLAFLLAFLTVTISHSNVYSLSAGAVLAAGLAVIVGGMQWFELEIFGILASYLNHYLWLRPIIESMQGKRRPFPEFAASAGILAVYWLIFRISYVFRQPSDERQERISTGAALLNTALLLALFKYQSTHPEWAFWALLAIGAIETLLGQLAIARRRRRSAVIVLSTLGVVLLIAAFPFRYSGMRLSALWLLEAEALLLIGVWTKEAVFRRLGMMAALLVSGQMIAVDAARICGRRMDGADLRPDFGLAMLFLAAGAVFYANAHWVLSRWVELFTKELDRRVMQRLSYAAALMLLIATWSAFPESWTAVAWSALGLGLALAARRFGSWELRYQANFLALASVIRVLAINLEATDKYHGLTVRFVTITLVAALLYVTSNWSGDSDQTRGRALGGRLLFWGQFASPAYTWSASSLLALLAWYELRPVSVADAWLVGGLVLFELGLARNKFSLRLQGYTALAAAFLRIFFVNLNAAGNPGEISPRFYTVVPLALGFYYAYWRLHESPDLTGTERRFRAAEICCWLGTITFASLMRFELEADWVAGAWAALALGLLAVAWRSSRREFLLQGMLVAAGVLLRTVLHNFYERSYFPPPGWENRWSTVGIAIALLLAALPFAFRLRRKDQESVETGLVRLLQGVVRRPEQLFFFSGVGLLTGLLAIEMRHGMVTLAWGVEGLSVFILALWLGERSFRLTGLALLLLCAGKILLVDVWRLDPRDRYLTLIVLGAALLLVSFLYTRNREALRQYL